MLKLFPLFSSSSGNMYLIESHKTNILIDVGVSYKKIVQGLDSISKTIKDISAIYITHEHSDHIKGLDMIAKNTDVKIYASKLTTEYIKDKFESKNISTKNLHILEVEKEHINNDITIIPFSTSHDALEPFGYKIESAGKILTIATDLGQVTFNVFSHLRDSCFSVIECNYDNNMLLAGKYPFDIKRRIQSSIGHLSNEQSSQAVMDLAKDGCRNFLLGHISENNNMPLIAKQAITTCLNTEGFNLKEFNIGIASKDLSSEVYVL